MKYQEALARLQGEELELLQLFSSYCRKHNLTWSLGGGSLLGALRHEGFIPWDDDVDIFLESKDYERLIELVKHDPIEGCDFLSPGDLDCYAPMFSKLQKRGTVFQTAETREAGFNQGIFIDIFSADRLLLDERLSRKQIKRARMWQVISYIYHAKSVNVPHVGFLGAAESFGAFVLHYAFRLFLTGKKIAKKYSSAVHPSRTLDEDYSDIYFFFPSTGDNRFSCSILFPTKLARFENSEFPVPANAERVLELTYGEWKELPPPEKRHTHKPECLVFSNGERWTNPDQ